VVPVEEVVDGDLPVAVDDVLLDALGDFHLAGLVGYALTGERTDDPGMVRLLAPFAGTGSASCDSSRRSARRRPRQGARMTIQDHRRH